MTIDRQTWGFRRNAALGDYLSIDQLIAQLAQTVRFALSADADTESLTYPVWVPGLRPWPDVVRGDSSDY